MEIFGIRAVMEAINSSKDIDKVFIQIGLKGSLKMDNGAGNI